MTGLGMFFLLTYHAQWTKCIAPPHLQGVGFSSAKNYSPAQAHLSKMQWTQEDIPPSPLGGPLGETDYRCKWAAGRQAVPTLLCLCPGLAQLTEDEQRTPTGAERSMAAVLAWRMLRACLLFPESDVRKTDYDAFVKSMPAALRNSLKPLDVVEFIVSAAGLVKTEASMVVFAYDEVSGLFGCRLCVDSLGFLGFLQGS